MWQCAWRCNAQQPNRSVSLATIDADTRWTLKAVSTATVSSPIIRLGDVVQPSGAAVNAWSRLSRSPVAMFPVKTNRLTIDRDRLDRAIRKAEATPRAIDWSGPRRIEVYYDPAATSSEHVLQIDSVTTGVTPVAYQARQTSPPRPNQLAVADANRIVRWIELAIDRQHPDIVAAFDVQIDHQQASLDSLAEMGGVTSIAPLDDIASGRCRLRVVGRSPQGPIESTVTVKLTPFPQYVTPRTTIGRGHRISAADLEFTPIAGAARGTEFITDIDQLIGMEVRSTLRSGQPIRPRDVGPPILVHRGDLVEVRVLSGGVKVTTNAKALGDGAESALIEIETMRPRKRLLARVAQTGLVEIVTRAPSMSYRKTTR